MADPAYSMAWPAAPSAPIAAMIDERDVLGDDARRQRAVDGDAHPLRPLLPERLGHQHMGDLGGADAEGERAECAMGGGVAVAADHGQARQGQPLLGPDDMDDALAGVVEAEQPELMALRIVAQLHDHALDGGIDAIEIALAGRDVMILDAEGQVRPRQLGAARLQLVEGVERAFMQEMPVDPEQALPVLALHDDMRVPDLVEQCARRFRCRPSIQHSLR